MFARVNTSDFDNILDEILGPGLERELSSRLASKPEKPSDSLRPVSDVAGKPTESSVHPPSKLGIQVTDVAASSQASGKPGMLSKNIPSAPTQGYGGDQTFKAVCKAAISGLSTAWDREEQMQQVFRDWDSNGDGHITVEELTLVFSVLGKEVSRNDFGECVKDADTNLDGKIDYQEFVAWVFKAPNLNEYSRIQESYTKKYIDLTVACHNELLPDGRIISAEAKSLILRRYADRQASVRAELDEELEPVIRRAFHWHDKKENGVLERDESVIFFSNFAERFIRYREKHMVLEVASDITSTVQERCLTSGQAITRVDEQLNDWKKATGNVVRRKRDSFLRHMGARLKAAFESVDVAKDGMLQEEEVINGLLPSTMKHQELVQALGLSITSAEIGDEFDALEPFLVRLQKAS